MSTVMSSADLSNADLAQDANHAPHHRRSREEVEALAKTFVATPVEDEAPPKSRGMLLAAAAVGAVVLAGVVAYFAWPSSEEQAARPAPAAARTAAAEVEELRQRLEAERERQRQELQAGTDYMAKMAAADAALVKDLSAQADKLADRQAALATAAPARSTTARSATADALPTPRDETARPAAAPAKSTATTTTAAAAPAAASQKATAAPAQQQPAQAAPAAAQPAPVSVAEAPKASCSIHVSELSSSGKLTYEDVKRMKGARVDESTGHVFTPPVPAARGRTVVFEVMPDGCVSVGRR